MHFVCVAEEFYTLATCVQPLTYIERSSWRALVGKLAYPRSPLLIKANTVDHC